MANIKKDKNKNLFHLNHTITIACLNENEFIKQFLQSKEGIFEQGLPDENNNSFISYNSYDHLSEISLSDQEKKDDNYFLEKGIFDTSMITLKNESTINSTNQTFREINMIIDEVI